MPSVGCQTLDNEHNADFALNKLIEIKYINILLISTSIEKEDKSASYDN